MKAILHPSRYIAADLANALRDVAGEAEQLKQLHPAQLAIIYGQKWFKLFVPKEHGGLGMSLPEALRLEEALAWTDGSVAWTVTLCAGAGWFIGFLDPEIIPTFFEGDTVCLAGSGKPTGIARSTGNGYEVSGYWDYASGSQNATSFTANCLIEENGAILKKPDGSPEIVPFIFGKDEVIIHQTWKAVGMIATGSHSFEARSLLVAKNRAFALTRGKAHMTDPVYRYPFLQLAEATLAVNSSGMAQRFLDLCEGIIVEKFPPAFEAAAKELWKNRQAFFEAIDVSWEACAAHSVDEAFQVVSQASRKLAFISRTIVDELYPLCGMMAANPATEINRVWRNLHTASQHSLLNSI